MIDSDKPLSQKKNKAKEESELFKDFLRVFEHVNAVEEKIEIAVTFMRKVLSQSKGLTLKDFWEAKKLCGPLFKEPMNPVKRNHLWSEYAQLTDEARKLKEIVDEQTAFSVEQIELAIEALEKEMDHFSDIVSRAPALKFPKVLKNLQKKEKSYSSFQKELQLLKAFISRLDALRKEVLATDMRISHKNRILKRLSKLGDIVFPRRKELIKTVSDQFLLDVQAFAEEHFPKGEEKPKTPYYAIRDGIKAFQSLAKALTLNAQAFNQTRKLLGECWDKIKELEQEYRKEMEERSEEHKVNFDEFSKKVADFVAFCEKEENLQRSIIVDAADTIQEGMRALSLSRDQVSKLRSEIQKARLEALDKIEGKIQAALEVERKKIQTVKDSLKELIQEESKTSLEVLEEKERALREQYQELSLGALETLVFERDFSDLRSFALDKKSESSQSTEAFEKLFDERQDLFDEVKKQIEVYRKEMGSSNLDFEKAMTYRELYDSAKIHLDKEMEALQQLEEKLNAN